MPPPKRRPPCPRCEGQSQTSEEGGYANDETIPIMRVSCDDCGFVGVQYTSWVPGEVTGISSFDEDYRMANRAHRRAQRGRFAQVRSIRDRRGARITSDTLVITCEVIPGRVQEGLAKRLEALRRHHRPTDEEQEQTA